ncbi:uncharacterized protein TRAVEDRAFT_51746 [Trametes versicolor FP-101664 SS1]|uniref:uncharacterized protein n=1 Tax=Trametes versicolor (strain FP-101664) TaxID=717944 RepID=UPI0004623920|nr:uncharacterized protein TRAVEDRAFT_51746 [Trametes versicolor FP-101664 SS1]EIW54014.1 hypothetical protein TRAVEDRAFT_51746 [Trametes versicolor FP-101664 SS1]
MSTSSTQSTGSTPEGSRGSLDEHFAYVENMTARRVAVGAVVAKATYVHVQPKKDGDAAKGQGAGDSSKEADDAVDWDSVGLAF